MSMYALYIYEQNPRWAEDYDDALVVADDKDAAWSLARDEGVNLAHAVYTHGKECETFDEAVLFLTTERLGCTFDEAAERLSDPKYHEFMADIVIRG